MSSILYDPSESREGTRLPQDVIKIGRPVNALERVTRADILVTIGKFKTDDLSPLVGLNGEIFTDQSPGEIAKQHSIPLPVVLLGKSFKSAVNNGLLIQRKTGRDLTSSIPNLAEILYRMQKWTDRPWLLFVGAKYAKGGKCVIDSQQTNYTASSVEGALSYWQLRGGFYSHLTYDREVKGWLSGWLDRLRLLETQDEKVIGPRKVHQTIITDNEKPWKATLASIPGLGQKKVDRIASMCPTLAGVLEWATDPQWLYDYEAVERPKGVTLNDILNIRSWFGITDVYEQFVTIAVPPGKRFTGIYLEEEKDGTENKT